MNEPQDPEAADTDQTTSVPAVDLPRLVLRLRSAVAQMAPHQKEQQNGRLLVEALAEIEMLEGKFTKLDKPKYSGSPMLDHVLQTENPDFRAWVESLPPTYWARYDLSAARIGWEAAIRFISENDKLILHRTTKIADEHAAADIRLQDRHSRRGHSRSSAG